MLTMRRNLEKHRTSQHGAKLKTGEVELAVTGSAFKILQLMGKAQDLLYYIRVFARVKPEGKVRLVLLRKFAENFVEIFNIAVSLSSACLFSNAMRRTDYTPLTDPRRGRVHFVGRRRGHVRRWWKRLRCPSLRAHRRRSLRGRGFHGLSLHFQGQVGE